MKIKFLIFVALFFLVSARASAATINTGPDCPLLDAVISAQTNTSSSGCVAGFGADTINITQDETISSEYDSSGNSFPVITEPLTINGNGYTIIHENPGFNLVRLFQVVGTDFTLDNIKFEHTYGFTADDGGMIHATDSVVTLKRSDFSSFNAGAKGGVIYIQNGNLVIQKSNFSGNWAYDGGAIYIDNGNLNIQSGNFSGNSCWNEGCAVMTEGQVSTTISSSVFFQNIGARAAAISAGANSNGKSLTVIDSEFIENSVINGNDSGAVIWKGENGTVKITRTTFFGNQGSGFGAGFYNEGSSSNVIVINSTFSDNHTNGPGSAILNVAEGVRLDVAYNTFINNDSFTIEGALSITGPQLVDSVVENNIFTNNDGDCNFASHLGVNFVNNLSDDGSCSSVVATNISSVLAHNGGPTRTHALLAGSNAVDTAVTDMLLVRNPCPKGDQRIYPRMIDGNNDGILKCDIGAYERQKKIAQTVLKPFRP